MEVCRNGKGRTYRRRKQKVKMKYCWRANSLHKDQHVIELLRALKTMNWTNETNLELREFDIGRGVCSNQTLNDDDVLIKMPIRCMITLDSFTIEDFTIFKQSPIQQLTMQTLLALFLCIELHMMHTHDLSKWKFYLNSLPLENPLKWLQSEEIICFIPHLKMQFHEVFQDYMNSYCSGLAAVDPHATCPHCDANYLDSGIITKDIFTWCYSMINTRSIYFDPKYLQNFHNANIMKYVADVPNLALCPFLDMFNHSDDAHTTPEIVNEDGELFYVLRTYRKQERYQQIFISYGGVMNNTKLFFQYGFWLPENKFDTWPIPFSDLCTILKFSPKEYKYVIAKELDKNLYVNADATLSYNLKAVIFVSLYNFKEAHRIYSEDYTEEQSREIRRVVYKILDLQESRLLSEDFQKLSEFKDIVGNQLRFLQLITRSFRNTFEKNCNNEYNFE